MSEVIERHESEPAPLKIADVFPGQGFVPRELVGTARGLFNSPKAERVLTHIDAILGPIFPGIRVFSDLILNGSEEEVAQLSETENAQPAVLAVSMASVAALEEFGQEVESPFAVSGHSAGIVGALWRAGALGRMEALWLARERGEAIRDAKKGRKPGAMAAVTNREPIDIGGLEKICSEFNVELVNLNSPMQIVVSGRLEDVVSAGAGIKFAGHRVTSLSTSDAFHHSELMKPAVELFAKSVDRVKINDPKVPVYLNSTGQPLAMGRDITRFLPGEIAKPVDWVSVVNNMKARGISAFREFGHGSVLTGLVKRINPDAKLANIGSIEQAKSQPFQ
ncbi:MAG: hypothetical protein A3C30_03300 [Candidatus Levybacteria bacterium RIFCSPHIGHO2_02_FULL_40_18]|nr:MAG: hypothetical protein A2869_01980 [Candidatus Levybacteria bacterium RIFCSPHIGHO2_01_FULL_40_58]OGH26117.1 MAG: hypothetical protein A3C30_03300 [Candidatus Levybacteria bacterium RIFCSPHIGHO2_02_FULL_40_18]OGH32098.1 MAG: hypothetical protein A3E43_04160 [Candidatus Levybacteria bacterium RIFCSPHIGHO2_12_FULL_40_31]OGH39938.1 MAG: hypothetical protein A2894_02605 [Candidatus Levybacteria bacterium RIFCSPLOWO2_01_FULL_40_64]OGH49592.1 MAG: hypothetical protein A3I54_05085 [Candidatus Lev